jgi:hypothetical protein
VTPGAGGAGNRPYGLRLPTSPLADRPGRPESGAANSRPGGRLATALVLLSCPDIVAQMDSVDFSTLTATGAGANAPFVNAADEYPVAA